jgi:predicted dehydrogenase
MTKLTASVIGCGMGGGFSLDALAASDRFEIVAACDMRPEVCAEMARRHPGIRTFSNHQACLRDCPADVVCVSTFATTHGDITEAALQVPLKGILVEKPLAHTVNAAETLLAAIREKQIPVCVPHGLLVLPHTVEILRRVQDGEIGELKLVEIQCNQWDIMNAGIHWLNFFVALTGDEPMRSVMAQCDTGTRTYRDGMQVETEGITYVESKSGIRCVMQTGDEIQVNREGKFVLFRLVGTRGLIEFWAWESEYILCNKKHPGGERIEVPASNRSIHQIYLEALADQIEERRPEYAAAERSLAALELVEAAYLSARHPVKVDLPIMAFSPPETGHWDPGQPYSGRGGGRDGRRL